MPETTHGPASFGAELPREPRASAIARRLLDDELSELYGEEVVDDVKTVVSELVSNAYVHGRGAISLHVEPLDDRIRVEVADEGRHAALVVRPGHGLQIVSALSLDWGAHVGTTHVWAELPLVPRPVG